MAKTKKQMSESELTAQVQMEMQQSIAWIDGTLSEQRRRALQYYNGEQVGDLSIQDENRSKVVSHDVSDTVEWILPSLLKIFFSGDEVVRFDPQGPEDEKRAQQATEYSNWIITKDNPGFLIFYTWFKDALIQKNGILKTYWEETEDFQDKTVEGMDDDTYTILLADPDVEITAHTEYEPPTVSSGVGPAELGAATPVPGPLMHDVTYRKKKTSGKVCIENIPPEEFLISRRAKTIEDAIYVGHRTRKTLSDLIQDGYDKAQVETLQGEDALMDFNMEAVTRRENDLPDDEPEEHSGQNRQVWVEESYIRIDYDGDGIAEMRRVVTANQGKTILKMNGKPVNDVWEGPRPFDSLTPIIQPHKFFGLSIADTIMDLQTIKSVIMRGTLDSMYLSLNPRAETSPWVNMDDYLDSRPGGAIRTLEGADPAQTHVKWQTVPFVGQQALPVLEYLDMTKSNRTGVTAYNQGIDADSLNKTASGISQIMNAAQQRIELIARIFAETGVTDLFRKILYTVTKYQQKERIIRLRNEWVPMDPRQWDTEFDVTISVGLGTGNKDQQLIHLNTIGQIQAQIIQLQGGAQGPLVTMENVFNTASKIVENSGLKNEGNRYFTDPQANPMPPQEPKPDPEMIKIQVQAQNDQAKLQLETEKTRAELELEREKAMAEIALEREKLQIQVQTEAIKMQTQNEMQREKMGQDFEVKKIAAQPAPNFVVKGDGVTESINEQIGTLQEPVTQLAQAIMQVQQQSQAADVAIMQQLAALAEAINKPKELIVNRGMDGKIASAIVAPINTTVQ